MPLARYRSKRNFRRTPEPNGSSPSGRQRDRPLVFVVQKHNASHLHYDFRLEMEGALKSWAVPKGPSINPADKRLAMKVEDHPFDYREFEGTIPEGNYGAGTVIIWDQGTYHAAGERDRAQSESRLLAGLEKGHLDFVLNGKKLKGEFSLVKIKGREANSWLLIKKQDEFASKEDVTVQERSVQSGRTLDEIAAEGDDGPSAKAGRVRELGRKGSLPHGVKPMLAALADEPFNRAGWIFEIKWDGFRAIAELERGRLALYSRKNQDLAPLFPPVVDALRGLDLDAVLDGEIVVVDDEGRSRFELLQNYRRTGQGTPVMYVFDLLYFKGRRLFDVALVDRRRLLAQILQPSPHLHVSESVTEGLALYEAAKEKGLEGIIAKDGRSPYQPGVRSTSWLKIKTLHQQDAVIGGFTRPRGSRKALGALVLGVFQGDDLIYIGHTGGGLDLTELAELRARLDPLITDKSPFKNTPKTNTPATWVKPELICEVRYSNWTREGYMRQPIYLGLREDKNPKEVTRDLPIKTEPPLLHLKLLAEPHPHSRSGEQKKEVPAPRVKLLSEPRKQGPSRDGSSGNRSKPGRGGKLALLPEKEERLPPVYAEFTHLGKVLWPDEGYTKRDLIEYYRSMAPLILPYLRDRPQSLHRFPNGIKSKGFFQKNVETHPPWVNTIPIEEAAGDLVHYVLCQDESTLLYLANLGCIELNPWNSRVSGLDSPDYLVIDLDPLNIGFEAVIETAKEVHRVLDRAGAPSFPKTSGATGLHIYVPLAARYTTEQAVQFAKIVAYLVHEKLPGITSVERSPERRRECVYVDYLQNRKGQTLASAYSLRPRPGAPVSTPLKWAEVKKGLDPEDHNIKTIFRRLDRVGDLWQPVLGPGIDVEACLERLAPGDV